MGLRLETRLSAGQDLLDTDLCDLHVAMGSGGPVLYAGTGRSGGISVYSLGSGAAPQLIDSVYFGSLAGGTARLALDTLVQGNSARLVVGATASGALIGYAVGANGSLDGSVQTVLPGSGPALSAWAAVPSGDGPELLYTVGRDTGLLSAHDTAQPGSYQIAAGQVAPLPLQGDVLLNTLQTAGGPVVVATSSAAPGLVSYRVDAGTGALELTGRAGADEGLGFATPSALETVSAHGASWLILAAAGSSTLSVLRLKPDGSLTPTDHLLDTLETRFGGVQALAVTEADGHVFVFAGGADDGLAVFTLLPDGRLVHLQSLADAPGLGLDNISALQAVRIGDQIQIFATSGSMAGLSMLSWGLGTLGALGVDASAQAELLTGTAGDDTLMSRMGGADTLEGGGGDDILVAGAPGAVLRGGAGADLFVLRPCDGTLRIADFTPGQDRLDLTGFAMLRGPGQLSVTQTPSGLQARFGDTLILVDSAQGQSLSRSDLWPTGRFSTPDHLLFAPPPPQAGPLYGTAANDILAGTPGNDQIWAGDGDDSVWADDGADAVWGGSGRDTLAGGAGNDTLTGGAGADTFYGGSGDDSLLGQDGWDRIWAGTGNDLLDGGAGDDVLGGSDGDDTLWGGDGNDALWGGRDNDRITGGLGHDRIGAGDGSDWIDSGAGNDTVWAGDGNDTLIGGDGDDALWAISGRDLVSGGAGNDTLGGGHGHDQVNGGAGDDLVYGGWGDDTLTGDDGADALWAMAGHDQVHGGAGNDTIGGGDGNDTLWGGAGDDLMFGGAGADIFVFGALHGQDRITGFVPGQDRIRFDGGAFGYGDLDLRPVAGGTEIVSSFGTIRLDGVAAGQIDADDFLFL